MEDLWRDDKNVSPKLESGKPQLIGKNNWEPGAVPTTGDLDLESRSSSKGSLSRGDEQVAGAALWSQQMGAVLWQRSTLTQRDRKAFCIHFVFPAVLAAMAVLFAMMREVSATKPALKLHRSMFSAKKSTDDFPNIPCSQDLLNSSLGFGICDKMWKASAAGPPVQSWALENGTMSQYLMQRSSELPDTLYGAASLADVSGSQFKMTLWFSQEALHSVPLMMSHWNRALMDELGFEKTSVQVWSDPLPNTTTLEQSGIIASLMVVVTIVLALAFMSASFVIHLVHERSTHCKDQHFATGLSPLIYWTANYAWDFFTFFVPMLLIWCLLQGCQIAEFSGPNALAVLILMFAYGLASLPQMYSAVQLFSVPATAYVTMICFNVFSSILTLLVVQSLELGSYIGSSELQGLKENILSLIDGLQISFTLCFPGYCLGSGLLAIARNHWLNYLYTQFGICVNSEACVNDALSWSVAGQKIAVMFIMMPLWILLVVVGERKSQWIEVLLGGQRDIQEKNEEEESILLERGRVKSLQPVPGDAATGLVMNGLHKVFGYGQGRSAIVHAVRGLYAQVLPGECFGLLGANGAGKTTTLRMISGTYSPSAGDASVNGYSVQHRPNCVRHHLGTCPQTDSVPPQLTTRETLEFYARLRGIPGFKRNSEVSRMLRRMTLEPHLDTWTMNLSGGNRRKLSVAVALIGYPQVVLLDEPTIGIDVCARRTLWNVVCRLLTDQHCIALASHSMEECEALCSRFCLMENGRMRRLGAPVQLKEDFSNVYILSVKLRVSSSIESSLCEEQKDRNQMVKRFLAELLPNTDIEDRIDVLQCRFKATRQKGSKGVSELFAAMEEAVTQGGSLHSSVLDYTILPVSLEDALH